MQGKVKYFNGEKGYGFISNEGIDLFVHVSQILGQSLNKGDIVSYDLGEGRKGPEAQNVQVIEFSRE